LLFQTSKSILYEITIINNISDVINILKKMNRKKQIIYPKYNEVLEQMGENIKLARKRRKLTTTQLAERADIFRFTLYLIEKENEGVAIGTYFNVLRVLGLQQDFLKIAADDILGRKLQDLELLQFRRNDTAIINIYFYYMQKHIFLKVYAFLYSKAYN